MSSIKFTFLQEITVFIIFLNLSLSSSDKLIAVVILTSLIRLTFLYSNIKTSVISNNKGKRPFLLIKSRKEKVKLLILS